MIKKRSLSLTNIDIYYKEIELLNEYYKGSKTVPYTKNEIKAKYNRYMGYTDLSK